MLKDVRGPEVIEVESCERVESTLEQGVKHEVSRGRTAATKTRNECPGLLTQSRWLDDCIEVIPSCFELNGARIQSGLVRLSDCAISVPADVDLQHTFNFARRDVGALGQSGIWIVSVHVAHLGGKTPAFFVIDRQDSRQCKQEPEHLLLFDLACYQVDLVTIENETS